MKTATLLNYAHDEWVKGAGGFREIPGAVSGETVAEASSEGLNFESMLAYARDTGGPALRKMSFHDRAWMLKDLAKAIMDRKEELYELSYEAGCTRKDSWIDIDGGAMTLFSFSSRGRIELPSGHVLPDGNMEMLSKSGQFVGQHVYTSLQGAAVLINAFNFPVWGMLEKLGPCLLAGVPAIVKPATPTAYIAERTFRIMIETGVLPKGGLQFVAGGVGNMLDHLTMQDVVSFTGSAATSMKLQTHPVIARESVRFIAERDSLNASILGPDAAPGSPEFDLFIKEVVTEMTSKAGQKCTAIRRAIAPASYLDAVQEALTNRLASIRIGDPRDKETRLGALAGQGQLQDVRGKVAELAKAARIVAGDPGRSVSGFEKSAFMEPILLRSDDPWGADAIHDVEAFGPVATIMPYRDVSDAVALANRGMGSLALSLFTHDREVGREFVLDAGAYHGRMLILDRESGPESTGHGSPLPVLVHGGPGRAGGGEEMGGIRGVKHYMQRTALQGSPDALSAIIGQWLTGAEKKVGKVHPFRKRIAELDIGDTFKSGMREVTLEDIEHFAHFTGDTFYAHMNEDAAKANPIFNGRVAHGYLILSFAAGLFVDPEPGPVLANYGLENLRFLTPLYPGDSMRVELTVKSMKLRNEEMGEVRWAVFVHNQKDDLVASYDLLTMNAP